ncbi:hypothetical protein KR018_008486, partial [Drosophila ironensis]
MDDSMPMPDCSDVEDEEIHPGYDHEDIKAFVATTSFRNLFNFAKDTADARQLQDRFVQALSERSKFKLVQLLELFTLAIKMVNYQRENPMITEERFILLNEVCQLTEQLRPDELYYIAHGLYEKFVDGLGEERLEKILELHAAIPAMMASCRLGRDLAVVLLLIILGKYTETPVPVGTSENALKAFKMVQAVNWQRLADTQRHADMFMLLRTFSLIINCRQIREECPNWAANLGTDIHNYFLSVQKLFGHSTISSTIEMMVSMVV